MKHTKLKSAFGIGLAIVLAGGAATVVLAGDPVGDQLSTSQIFKQTRENYASLASYSDRGQIVTTVDGTTRVTPFIIRLDRPGFYLVEWQKSDGLSYTTPNAGVQMVWSSGAGDYLETGYGSQDEGRRDIALDAASSFSSGASTTIPTIFFNIPPGNELDGSPFEQQRQPDEKLGALDCYVFTSESQGRTKTLWIGKQDFLIHQVRTEITPEAAQAAVNRVSEDGPQLGVFLHDFISTETHTNIVANPQFSRADFIPVISHFATTFDDD
jgi:hypothetical protein